MSTEAETPAAPGCAAPAGDALSGFLARLDASKHEADVAETAFRREAAARVEALATARAHAYRRADLMATLAAGVRDAESAEIAVAVAQALLRGRLGWDADSEARAEVLARLAPVAVALHDAARREVAAQRSAVEGSAAETDPAAALAVFEDWYASTRQTPFWYLFEHYMPDTPRVDF